MCNTRKILYILVVFNVIKSAIYHFTCQFICFNYYFVSIIILFQLLFCIDYKFLVLDIANDKLWSFRGTRCLEPSWCTHSLLGPAVGTGFQPELVLSWTGLLMGSKAWGQGTLKKPCLEGGDRAKNPKHGCRVVLTQKAEHNEFQQDRENIIKRIGA